MRIQELSLRNYRVFEEVDLELPARVIGVFGPNGAGKSSLVGAIRFALYGTDRTAKDQIRTHGLLTDCEVRVVFEHGGQSYEVRRTIKGKNHQTEAELLVGELQLATGVREVTAEIQRLLHMDQQVFRASVFAEQKQLDAFSDITKGDRKKMVLRLLGIKPVDDAITAARREARDRTQDAARMAGALPDLAAQEAALVEARSAVEKAAKGAAETVARLAAAEKRATDAETAFAAAEDVRQKTERLTALRAQATEQAAALAARHDELAGRIEELGASLEALSSLQEELAGLAGARDLLEAAGRFVEAAEELRSAEDALEALAAADPAAALEELSAATEELRAAEKAATKAEASLETTGDRLAVAEEAVERAGELDAAQPCPTCGQELGAAYKDVVTHRRKEAAELKKAVTAATKVAREAEAALGAAQKRFAAAEKVGVAAQKAVSQREVLEKAAAAARAKVETLGKAFAGEAPDVEALEARARRAEELDRQVTQLTAERKHLAQTEKDLASCAIERDAATKQVAGYEKELAGLAFDPSAHEKVFEENQEAKVDVTRAQRDERDASDALKSADKEVATLEAGIEQVKELAGRMEQAREEARYVDRVGQLLGGFRDHLVSSIGPELSREAEALFRELTNHEYEDLKIDEEDLSIQIADGGTFFPMERFSGSEIDLANLALRVAISLHLSRMAGADVGMMVLDEVLASLDVERKDLMVAAMGRLSERFHQLFVITHAEQVKDAFPASIEVRKTGRRRSEAVLA